MNFFKYDILEVQSDDSRLHGSPRQAILVRVGGIRRVLPTPPTTRGTWFEAGNRAIYHECNESGDGHPVFMRPHSKGDLLVCPGCGSRTKAE